MLIRVDPTLLRQSSVNISGIGMILYQIGQSVLNLSSSSSSYDGQFGPRVHAIGQEAFSRGQGLSAKLDSHSESLQSRAQAFETADMEGISGLAVNISSRGFWIGDPLFSNNFQLTISNYMRLGNLTNYSGQSTSIKTSQIRKEVDWYKLGVIPITETIRWSKEIPWKSVGRFINNNLVGNMRGGWVGGMDILGNIIKRPIVKEGLPKVLGLVGDLIKGDNLDRAIGSEMIEAAADWGLPIMIGSAVGGFIGGAAGLLGGAGVGAIPGAVAGAAFGTKAGVAIYAGYQSVVNAGYVFSVGEQIIGNEQQALDLQNSLDKLDFGEYIGNKVYDTAKDFVTK
jgi:hypothetical protein